MKEFWSYLMDNGRAYPVGTYDAYTEWDKLFNKALSVGEGAKTEPVLPLCLDDLLELGSDLQNIYNKHNGQQDTDWLLIGAFIDAKDIPLLYKLARQHRGVEFLEMLVSDCKRARKIWKGKK